ncbi:DegV family protein [Clostridium sp.]|uniref:DegV family protein n=1 Tax=Clostridium sp. TaxID=1506 RepID=UPI003521C436
MCNSIGIVTDSNSGITSKEANEWGVTVIPMPFYINGELYYEGLTLNQKEFYNF